MYGSNINLKIKLVNKKKRRKYQNNNAYHFFFLCFALFSEHRESSCDVLNFPVHECKYMISTYLIQLII